MNNASLLLDLVKAGGILAGVVVTVGIFVVMFKYVLPVLISMRPANGDKNGAGPMFVLLQQLAGLPSEVKVLSTELQNVTKSIEDRVWTKDEVMRQFEKNRHDIANSMSVPVLKLANAMEKNFKEMRRQADDRRSKARATSDRRKR